MKSAIAAFLLVFLLGVLVAEPAAAQSAVCEAGQLTKENAADTVVNLFAVCASKWESTLKEYATRLFLLLATIEFFWAMARLVMRQADIGEILAELLNQVFFIGFFWFLLDQSAAIAKTIVRSFEAAAEGALAKTGVVVGAEASEIFNSGMNLAMTFWSTLSFGAIGQSLIAVFTGFFVIVSFALIAAAIVMAKVEAFIVISASVLFMGFGGSHWTKDYAVKTLVYAVSVGAKLFMLHLIAGLAIQIVKIWTARMPDLPFEGTNTENAVIVVGSTLVLMVLSRSIPDLVQGVINGTSPGASSGLVGAAGTMAGGVAAAAGTVYGVGMAVKGAAQLTAQQMREAKSTVHKPGPIGQTIANLGMGFAENLGDRLSGRAGRGNRFAQIGRNLRGEAHERAGASKRRPAGDTGNQASGSNAGSSNTSKPTNPTLGGKPKAGTP